MPPSGRHRPPCRGSEPTRHSLRIVVRTDFQPTSTQFHYSRILRNSPLVISRVPSVLRPSKALFASCWLVSWDTGTLGACTSPVLICWACQMNSCNSSPSFLVRSSSLACSMTLRRSLIRTLPSLESSFDGEERALEDRALFRATSHCLFYGRNENHVQYRDITTMRDGARSCRVLTEGSLRFLKAIAHRLATWLLDWRGMGTAALTYHDKFRKAGASS